MTSLTRYSLFTKKVQIDPKTKQPAERKIPGATLLNFFIPGEKLYLAQNDDFTTQAEIIGNAPAGTQLILVDRDDLIYGSPEAAAKLKQVLPIDYLAGAYSSIFKGGCQTLKADRPLKIAVVDFANGYNSGNANIPPEISRQLVHDSCGAIDKSLLKQLADKDSAIQFRMGVNSAEQTTFAKGFLNTIDLPQLFPNGDAPDMILSLDSFKGQKPIPGLYEYQPEELFFGIKNDSQNTTSAISEVLSIYPQAAPDVLPVVQAEAQVLAAHSQNLVLAAAWALNDYYMENESQPDEFNTINLMDMALSTGRYNLLNSIQVKDWLSDRLSASWRNLSFADTRSLNGNNATVLPCYDLKYGEIAVPWLKDGEEFVFYRSPVVNANGVVTVRNNLKAWEELQKLGADPDIMYVNVQTLDRIEAEDPDTYDSLIEAYGSEERLQAEFQTLMQSTQMDYDGDTANAISRTIVPNLYAAVQANEHPDAKLPNFDKRAKNLPTDMTLPEVATHIRPPYVNLVYAQKARLHLSKAEIDLAIEANDPELIDELAAEYAHRTTKALFKVAVDDLQGYGIDGEFHKVTLPDPIRAAAQTFIDSFDEQWTIDTYENAGYHRILFKLKDCQKSLSRFREEYDSLEFTTPDGKTKTKLSDKLSKAITEFNQVYLDKLIKKYPEQTDNLLQAVEQYQALSNLIQQEIDITLPINFTETRERFDKATKSFSKYLDTQLVMISRLATDPKITNTDRLKLYRSVLDESIVITSQLNQDAVDIFKSANKIEVELSAAIATNFSRSRFDSVSGKSKSTAYNSDFKPKPTGFSLSELLQDLCNQNYQPLDRSIGSIDANLVGVFKDIPTSEQALAIAGFYINDDREALDKFAEYNRIAKLAGRSRSYLQIKYGNTNINIFEPNQDGINQLKQAKFGKLRLNLREGDVTYTETLESGEFVTQHDVGSLDRDWCKEFGDKMGGEMLEFPAAQFKQGVARGIIDFLKVGDTKTEIQRERKAAVVAMRQAFETAGIDRLEALAAISKVTGRANPGLLLAAYPQTLVERIKVSPEQLLVLSTEVGSQIYQLVGDAPMDFYVDDKGELNIQAGDAVHKVDFAANSHLKAYQQSGDFVHKAKASMYSALPAGLMGQGNLTKEAGNLSIQLANNKRVLAVNLTDAGKAAQSAKDLALEPVKSEPYQIEIKGVNCPVVYASEGLSDILADAIGDDSTGSLQFKEFRANPRSLVTQKPSFSAIFEQDGKDYYLSGVMPETDAAGEKIDYSKLLSGYTVFKNLDRQIVKAEPTTIGYELYQTVEGNRLKLGTITDQSAIAANLTGTEQIISVSPNYQYRLDIPDPERIANTAVWKIQTEPTKYQPIVYDRQPDRDPSETSLKFAQVRAKLLDELSNNIPLVTVIKKPTIQNTGVEFKEFYQLNCPVGEAESVRTYLDKQKIPYQTHLDTHPDYTQEYRRGYQVFIVDPVELERKKGSKVDKLDRFTSQFGKPLEPDAYQQALTAARVVRPTIGQDLRKLGDWLGQAEINQSDELPAFDIDKPGKIPPFLKGLQAEARSRFGARMQASEDGQHTLFSFGVDYLRQQFNHALGDTLMNVNCTSQVRQRPVYAVIVPTAELVSYVREHHHQLSYNFDPETGSTINPVLTTFNVRQLDKLPARAAIDVAMGFSANKFIGKSLAEGTTRTDLYVEAYGQNANVQSYTADDIVMVTGNRFANKQIGREVMGKFFQAEYLPLLKSARKAGATIVVGNGNSVDALVKTYLSDSGYAILEHPSGYAEAVPQDRALERQAVLKQMVERTPAPAEPILPAPEVPAKKTSNRSAKTEAEAPTDGTKKRTTKAKTPVQEGEPTTSTKRATKAQAKAENLEAPTGTKRSSKARVAAKDTLASLSITATVETEVEMESLEPSLAM
jgi:hypothetical protein